MQQPSVRLNDDFSMQKWVYELEAYKRRLGRNFDRETNHVRKVWYFNRYNEVENLIQELCDVHGLDRKTKPYKLPLEALK